MLKSIDLSIDYDLRDELTIGRRGQLGLFLQSFTDQEEDP